MKVRKIGLLAVVLLLTVFQTYPQNMLICSAKFCEKTFESIVDKIYTETKDYINIKVIVPHFNGITVKEQEDSINDLITTRTEKWIKEAEDVADEYFKNGPKPSNPYELFATYTVTNRDDIVSLYIDYYQYSGGAHGITNRVAYNVDKKTGKLLSLGDLFVSGYDYKQVLEDEIYNQMKKEPDKYFYVEKGVAKIDDKTNFYIKDGKLVIYYGLYEIAPYASGIPEFIINKDLFKDNFKYDKI